MRRRLTVLMLLSSVAFGQATRSLNVSWQASPSAGVAGYNVKIAPGGPLPSDCPTAATAYSNLNSALVKGLSITDAPIAFNRYCVAATAVASTGEESALSPAAVVVAPPRTPALTCSGAQCSWTDSNPSTVSYKVWSASGTCPQSGVPAGASQLTTAPISAKAFTISQIGASCIYVTSYIKVGAVDLDGTPSNIIAVSVPPQPPASAPVVTLQIAGTVKQSDGTELAFDRITFTFGQ